jgi:oligopeptidase B
MLHQNLRLTIGRFFCIPLTVSVLLSSTLSLPSTALSHNYHHRRLMASPPQALSQSHSPLPPPAAKKVEHAMKLFNDVRIDNYYWLRDDSRSDPDVLSYLRQENAYTDSVMSGTNLISLSDPLSLSLLLFIYLLLLDLDFINSMHWFDIPNWFSF